jgi:transcriptional regulator
MYSPAHFEVRDAEEIRAFIRDHGFGIVLSLGEEGIEETHTPMFLSEDGKTLFGHIAKANGQWKGWAAQPKAKALFHGPHAYVSPCFYQSTFNVPTWNYTAVTVTGTISTIDSLGEQKEFIRRLVAQYEGGRPHPWTLDESDERMLRLFDAVVCFRVAVEKIEAKFKLNQNKSPEDQRGVIAGLRATGSRADTEVADLMEKNLSRR